MTTLTIDTAPVFEPLLRPARYKGAWGGRGSGKSTFFADLMVTSAVRQSGFRGLCVREVQKSLEQSAKKLIEGRIEAHGLGQYFHTTRERIETPGGGEIVFAGMQDHTAESIKSYEGFDVAWVEEAQTLRDHSLTLLRPTIRKDGSELWFSWNPRRPSDPVDRLLRGESVPPGAAVVQALWSDNPWFPNALDTERRFDQDARPEMYDHIWQGAYAQVTMGAYYASALAQARREGRIGFVAPDPVAPKKAFFDIGFSDATAIWIAQFIGTELRFIDYYEAVGQPLSAHLDWLRMNGHGDAQVVLPHDGSHSDAVTGTRFQDHVRAAGFKVKVIPNQGRGAAIRRVEAARRLFPSCRFDETRCAPGLEALGAYHERRCDKRDVGLGPEHDWSSDAADAFGLACICFETMRERPTGMPKVHMRPQVPTGWMC